MWGSGSHDPGSNPGGTTKITHLRAIVSAIKNLENDLVTEIPNLTSLLS